MLNHTHRIVVALSVLAMMLGVTFIPTLFAQRVTPAQQDTPLKILTLSGKVGTSSSTDARVGSRAASRPRPLSQAQRATLFKGIAREATKTFTLTPNRPTLPDKAKIHFVAPQGVFPEADGGDAWFDGGSTSRLYFAFKVKAGQLYAIDISVGNHFTGGADALYTLSNSNASGATQTTPLPEGIQHLTAYVTAEQDGWLSYYLRCSKSWIFFSMEVTEL